MLNFVNAGCGRAAIYGRVRVDLFLSGFSPALKALFQKSGLYAGLKRRSFTCYVLLHPECDRLVARATIGPWPPSPVSFLALLSRIFRRASTSTSPSSALKSPTRAEAMGTARISGRSSGVTALW